MDAAPHPRAAAAHQEPRPRPGLAGRRPHAERPSHKDPARQRHQAPRRACPPGAPGGLPVLPPRKRLPRLQRDLCARLHPQPRVPQRRDRRPARRRRRRLGRHPVLHPDCRRKEIRPRRRHQHLCGQGPALAQRPRLQGLCHWNPGRNRPGVQRKARRQEAIQGHLRPAPLEPRPHLQPARRALRQQVRQEQQLRRQGDQEIRKEAPEGLQKVHQGPPQAPQGRPRGRQGPCKDLWHIPGPVLALRLPGRAPARRGRRRSRQPACAVCPASVCGLAVRRWSCAARGNLALPRNARQGRSQACPSGPQGLQEIHQGVQTHRALLAQTAARCQPPPQGLCPCIQQVCQAHPPAPCRRCRMEERARRPHEQGLPGRARPHQARPLLKTNKKKKFD
eukprot:comp19715_c0_seq1/m.37896 comp19715_c0_seq1/g.37896  ORF comp19715_c0_seq1/g.37896 comp19715_c0_seq1/m.37896 type:complete len:392 (+) comp19715_c0_seq1:465-1640(+)